ncbi:bifunctional non-homologous end joining protein LigD [Amycolatopsis bartoniae]|uniref:DNA polymerase ligase N-terminal domain-containing protein n=1 Tax=Amycolatopsis bartoniae TaxID=941986 RepID=UPI00119139E6|nr:DNA polymerase ligase N-terminal domain-containing protein [Amycolatopsis bartoniae]MBB2937589.1 bifunctional non-homologous end joining protein LigD [Amycolatopsis bartoniae]TVT05903.1 ATP-dependent DNA ligase [Amycolatopsis bartoniae]
MADLSEYRRKRDPKRTPEPVPAEEALPKGDDDTFVIQEHHARRLHWDVRFEREGVLVSWAVPKGLPPLPDTPRLAVHTEDHPLEYSTFEGTIPAGEYGGGVMKIWDRGFYETLHWGDHKVEVVLHGSRVRGKYLFVNRHSQEEQRDWIVRRLDPPQRKDFAELPEFVQPMVPRKGNLPADDAEWAYEFLWAGERAQARVEGGRLELRDADGHEITELYPELKGLGEELGSTEVLLDGELIAMEDGRPSPAALSRRAEAADARAAKRLVTRTPVLYLPFDVLHLDGRSQLDQPYSRRRQRLRKLTLEGESWRVPQHYVGGGEDVLAAALDNGLTGITAKRLDSPYEPGKRSVNWRVVTRKGR